MNEIKNLSPAAKLRLAIDLLTEVIAPDSPNGEALAEAKDSLFAVDLERVYSELGEPSPSWAPSPEECACRE